MITFTGTDIVVNAAVANQWKNSRAILLEWLLLLLLFFFILISVSINEYEQVSAFLI